MATKEVYICDICGAERKEANHWFVAMQHIAMISIHAWEKRVLVKEMAIRDAGKLVHVCGQDCAHKLLDQFLSGELK